MLHLRTRLDAKITLEFLEHLIDLPYAFFQQRSAGDLMMRLNSNATIREVLTSSTLSGLLDGSLVSLYLILLFLTHVPMGLLVLGLVVGVLLAVVLAALGPWLPTWFTDDPAVVDQVKAIYFFIVVMQPLNALVFVWDGIVIGAADFRYLAGAMVVAGAAGTAVMILVIPLGWGLAGVWWGIVVLMLARAATLARWQWSPRAFRLH